VVASLWPPFGRCAFLYRVNPSYESRSIRDQLSITNSCVTHAHRRAAQSSWKACCLRAGYVRQDANCPHTTICVALLHIPLHFVVLSHTAAAVTWFGFYPCLHRTGVLRAPNVPAERHSRLDCQASERTHDTSHTCALETLGFRNSNSNLVQLVKPPLQDNGHLMSAVVHGIPPCHLRTVCRFSRLCHHCSHGSPTKILIQR
jgi:hypothetical protein